MKHYVLRLPFLLLLLAALLGAGLSGCEPREDIITTDPSATLTASVAQVKFDTVFTQLGSVSKRFWVYNRNSKAVRVDEISLVGVSSAVARFELIINGRRGAALRDFELRGRDSVLVLASVTINPNAADTAFVVLDSVRLRANGTTGYVRLRAYGENARYYDAPTDFVPVVACGEVWGGTDRRPIVLLKTTIVDSACVLTVAPGARVYVANGASLLVRGRLRCGELGAAAVKFRGLRRDDFFDTTDPRYFDFENTPKYANTPGQWGTIAFEPRLDVHLTQENELLNTDIRNATVGVLVANGAYFRPGHRVRIEDCIIRNAFAVGVYGEGAGYTGSGAPAEGVRIVNTVITRCGERAVLGVGGGNWRLSHCTIEMGPGGPAFARRETEAVAFDNKLERLDGTSRSSGTYLRIENSIVWSGVRDDDNRLLNELLLLPKASPDSVYIFRHNILQTRFGRFNTDGATYGEGQSGTNRLNENPVFRAPAEPVKQDLCLDSLRSPARRLGVPLSPAVPLDLLRETRSTSAPSAGAYESLPL